jgi:cysteine desulfuration protein SufE
MTETEALIDDFDMLDDWEERYQYIIELGKGLDPLSDQEKTEQTLVPGCASQVWLVTEYNEDSDPEIIIRAESDAHIVKGLLAIVIRVFSGRHASEIESFDFQALFQRLNLSEHLTQQRANGLFSVIERIKHDAMIALKRQSV